jgi:hypothetical protein
MVKIVVVKMTGARHVLPVFRSVATNLSLTDDGNFSHLPAEIVFFILSHLGLEDVGNFSVASSATRSIVAGYITTRSCLSRVSPLFLAFSEVPSVPFSPSTPLFDAFKSHLDGARLFAVLCKRFTFLQSTGDRVRGAFKLFEMALATYQPRKGDWFETLYTVQFFAMLHVFTLGWDESEYPALLYRIDKKFGISGKLEGFFYSDRREDVCVGSEMHLRLVLRCLTWDFAGSDYGHRAVRLSAAELLIYKGLSLPTFKYCVCAALPRLIFENSEVISLQRCQMIFFKSARSDVKIRQNPPSRIG